MNLIILGPAGSGKTVLTASFGSWLKKNRVSSASINLDPGADALPYKAAWDIRKRFTVREIMKKEKLGPNGAMMKSMDLLLKQRKLIANEINSIDSEIRLIDCPGQLEIFVFHDAIRILESLKKPTIALFLIPAELAKGRDLIVSEFLSLSVRLRIGIPFVNVISKADRLRKTESKSLLQDMAHLGMEKDLAIELDRISRKLAKQKSTIKVSALRNKGFDELYSATKEALCECGE